MRSVFSPEVRALLWKELRQVRRSRGALLTATFLPILLMVVQPMGQLLASEAAGGRPRPGRGLGPSDFLPPGMSGVDEPFGLFLHLLFPLFVMLGGLIVPPVATSYTVVAERERRSIELLMALPLLPRDILTAKVLAMLLLAAMVVLPLYAVDVTALLVLRVADVGYVLLVLALLLSALFCSVGVALLVALLARDFRTANNLGGAFLGPTIVVAVGVLLGVPGTAAIVVLIALLLVLGVASLLIAQRWLTFERYLA